jgi:hypothetical protein
MSPARQPPSRGEGWHTPAVPSSVTGLFGVLATAALPVGDFAVFGSGPLLVRGVLDEAHYLDVLCRGEAWERARAIGERTFLPDPGVEVYAIAGGKVTFGDRWAIGSFDTDRLIDSADMIDGIPFVRPEHVVRYKTIANRPRDIAHLERLRAFEQETGAR